MDENNCPFQFGSDVVHVSPEFVDTNMSLPAATSLVPSAEPAMDTQPVNGAPVCVQICALVEWMKKDRLPAATAIKGNVFMALGSGTSPNNPFATDTPPPARWQWKIFHQPRPVPSSDFSFQRFSFSLILDPLRTSDPLLRA
jgi:hypothetical protein